MNILILGDSSDAHAAHLMNAIAKVGLNVYYLDTNLFPTQVNISWEPKTEFGSIKLSKDHKLSFKDIHSVFWRSFNGVNVPHLEDINQQEIAFNDSMSLIRTFMKSSPKTHWVNTWEAYQFHKEKPLQLQQVKRLGIKIPDTLVTNEVDEVIEFANNYEKLIFKPVYGGAHTQILNASLLEIKRLNLALSICPVTLQEYIPGTNIRSYVIGNSVYSAEIRSKSLDFREDLDASLIPVILPKHVEQQCRDIAKALYLEWTAIDWRLNPAGEYVFLEANPSPMFIYFEQQTGFPITEKLVELLMS
jgi:glutathione synthase/RimK-type ligase-like ATP-grasp enzyme